MKLILPVFLALCLGVAPVFSKNVSEPVVKPAAASVAAPAVETETEIETVEVEQSDLPPVSDVSAAAATVEKTPEPTELANFGSDVPQFPVWRTVGGMGLVLCLLVGAYFGIRKFAPGYFPKTSPGGKNLKVVESIGMGDRRSIALVEAGGKRFLIGSTPQQINLLTTLPEHFSLVAEDSEANDTKKEVTERQTFRNMFEMGKKQPVRNSGNVLPDEIRQKMRRLHEALENR